MSKALQNGIDALMFLSTRKSAGVTEIAAALGVNKSTAFRIMETFQKANMVEKNPESAKYRLGPAILKLSQQYYGRLDVISAARPYMTKLCEITGESSHLCVYSDGKAVVVEQIIADMKLVVNASIGHSEPLHASSVGKCLLAFADADMQEKMIAQIAFEKYTEKTITDEARLKEELAKVVEAGFSIDDGELSGDIACVAVPIFNNRGECRYSLGVSGAKSRMTDEKIMKISTVLRKCSDTISAEMGFMGRK